MTLSAPEREALGQLLRKGKGAARKLLHARILLKADSPVGWQAHAISAAVEVRLSTRERGRERFVADGVEAALERQAPKRVYKRKLDGEPEAPLGALVCGQPLADRGRWPLKLLAQKRVEGEDVDSVAPETIRQTLKKMNGSPG